MPRLVLSELRGIDANKAALQLPPGDVQFSQNVWTRPFKNWAKRRGVEPVSEQDGPVFGIFELDLDNIVIPITANAGTLTFFPIGNNGSTIGGGDPYNPGTGTSSEDLDPEGGRTTLFLIEPTMRAISERYAVRAAAPPTWPKRYFDEYGNYNATGEDPTISRNVNEWRSDAADSPFLLPVNNFYQYDLEWTDKRNGDVQGTYATALINSMRTAVINLINGYAYVNNDYAIEGESSVTFLAAGDVPAAATVATYRSAFANLKTFLRKVQSFTDVSVSQVLRETRGSGNQFDSTCVGSRNLATDAWNNTGSWVATGNEIRLYGFTQQAGFWGSSLVSVRGKIQCDLTTHIYPGNGYLYLVVAQYGSTTNNNPPVTADSKYRAVGTITTNADNLTGYYANRIPSYESSCPLGGATAEDGWLIDDQLCQVYPTWQYNF